LLNSAEKEKNQLGQKMTWLMLLFLGVKKKTKR